MKPNYGIKGAYLTPAQAAELGVGSSSITNSYDAGAGFGETPAANAALPGRVNYGVRGDYLDPAAAAELGIGSSSVSHAYDIDAGFTPATSAPGAPTSLSATAGNAEVSLTWSAPADVGSSALTDYVVQYSANNGSTWTTFSDGTSTSTSATVAGLTNDTLYKFRVAASNSIGDSDWSSEASATPILPVITITQQPSNQTASNGAATFTAAATVTGGATLSYQWQKQDGGSGSFANVSGATSASLALSGLAEGDSGDVYRCVVSATGGAESVTTSSATLTVPGESPATPPILLATFAGHHMLDEGPNNYWLGDGNVGLGPYLAGSSYQLPATTTNVSGPFGGRSLEVGGGTMNPLYGTIRTSGSNMNFDDPYLAYTQADAGLWHFFTQLLSSFTIEMFYRPGTGSLTTYDQYLGYAERYFTAGGFTVSSIANDANNPDTSHPVQSNYTAIFANTYETIGSQIAYTTTVPTSGAWNHIALAVDYGADEARLYINGTLACTGDATPHGDESVFQFGPSYAATLSHMSNLRVSSGAIYSGATITVPTANFAYTRATNATTELLLRADHGLEDWGHRRYHLRADHDYYTGAAEFSGQHKKFGEGSYIFYSFPGDPPKAIEPLPEYDAMGDPGAYHTNMHNVFDGGAFTVEMWLRPSTFTANSNTSAPSYSSGIGYGQWSATDGETYFAIPLGPSSGTDNLASNWLVLYDNEISIPYYIPDANGEGVEQQVAIPGGGVTLELIVNGVSARVTGARLTRDAWHHVAVVCDPANGVLRLKIDGAQAGTIAIPSGTWAAYGTWAASNYGSICFGSAQNLNLNNNTIAGKYIGFMDDIRISSAALYGTGSYSVPSAALT